MCSSPRTFLEHSNCFIQPCCLHSVGISYQEQVDMFELLNLFSKVPDQCIIAKQNACRPFFSFNQFEPFVLHCSSQRKCPSLVYNAWRIGGLLTRPTSIWTYIHMWICFPCSTVWSMVIYGGASIQPRTWPPITYGCGGINSNNVKCI